MLLVEPSETYLDGYMGALKLGWSPGDEVMRLADMQKINSDPKTFLRLKADNRHAEGPPVTLPDGSLVERLPGLTRWLWDGEFCGSINLRWPREGYAMPPQVRGNVGYAVVPWKRKRGYATVALRQLLPIARDEKLPHLDFVIEVSNTPSKKVVERNGALLIEYFQKIVDSGRIIDCALYRLILTK
ncbi:GNAT family N-acetyltransferase [Gluconacetobacter sacchari]|uniref:GNAT family N-acetyltransferase n=1 Tax=Gluconacetobacter sacchari TaxID=92759 RepID=UPI0039B641B6